MLVTMIAVGSRRSSEVSYETTRGCLSFRAWSLPRALEMAGACFSDRFGGTVSVRWPSAGNDHVLDSFPSRRDCAWYVGNLALILLSDVPVAPLTREDQPARLPRAPSPTNPDHGSERRAPESGGAGSPPGRLPGCRVGFSAAVTTPPVAQGQA